MTPAFHDRSRGREADALASLQHRRRINVIGCGGAGKSTFSRELAAVTGLPLIHLDRHYWNPGWVPTPPDKWQECVRGFSSGDSWIMDGNYSGTLPIRIERCDAVVFFDLPRMVCVRGILQRWLLHGSKPRPDVPPGCPERLDLSFIRWVWDYPRNSRPRIQRMLKQAGPFVDVHMITQRAHARELLDGLSSPEAR